ncbi:MAG: metallophosphoesterase [Phycisphaerae bacterium]|nr:metallophosphoesterase [Phycisphaerae bacterium]
MRETVGFLLFVAAFVALCGAGNFYILWRFSGFFGYKHGAAFWTVFALLTFSYVLSLMIHDLVGGKVTTMMHEAAALWLGIGLLFVSALVIYDVFKYVVKVPGPLAGSFIIVVVSALTVYAMHNAGRIFVREVEIPAPVEMNIVQLSDIHLGSDGSDFLRRVVDMSKTCSPDLVLITGDLIDPRSGITEEDLACLDDFSAPVFLIIGNHERYAGVEEVMQMLSATKVRPLRNEAVQLEHVQIIGIDDSNNSRQVAETLQGIPIDPSRYNVLMYHRPQGFEAAADAGIDLMLAGHTHNGQIAPFNLLVRLAFSRIKGLHRYGDSWLMISTGTGTWGPKMRLGSRNEIVLLKLRKKG